jgi:Trk K+ transport system NAD-binding subunit
MNPDSDDGGSDRVTVAADSPIADQSLRHADLPPSVIVTTIQRNRDLVVPNGDTVLIPGDELVLIGNPDEIAVVRDLAMADAGRRSSPSQNDAKVAPHRHTTPK